MFKLRVFLDAKYPGIVDACAAAIRALRPANRIGRRTRGGGYPNSRAGSSIEVWSDSRSWPCLIPQHGPGRKHERPIVLAGGHCALVASGPESLLRGLNHSDGCRFMNTGRNASADIRRIFCDACDVLGLRHGRGKDRLRVADGRRRAARRVDWPTA